MLQRLLLAAALVSILAGASAPTPALAVGSDKFYDAVYVTNHTDRCAWITLYTANYSIQMWSIETGGNSHPQVLKPHAYLELTGFRAGEVKLRAEVKSNKDCTGHTVVDTYDERKNPLWLRSQAHFGLYPNGSRYNIWAH
jgi:hypothetical protein